jgi:hypothetical protein
MTHAIGRLSIETARATGTFLKKKEYQVRQPFSGRRLGAAIALTTLTVIGGLAIAPAAFAGPAGQAKPAATAATSASAQGSEVKPAGAGDCTDLLEIYGYTVTIGRASICLAAAIIGSTSSNPPAVVATCAAGLISTHVGAAVATTACFEAVYG